MKFTSLRFQNVSGVAPLSVQLCGKFLIRKVDAGKTTYVKVSRLHILRLLLQVNRNIENLENRNTKNYK